MQFDATFHSLAQQKSQRTTSVNTGRRQDFVYRSASLALARISWGFYHDGSRIALASGTPRCKGRAWQTKRNVSRLSYHTLENLVTHFFVDHEQVQRPKRLFLPKIHQQNSGNWAHTLAVSKLVIITTIRNKNIEELLLLCAVSFAKIFVISKTSKSIS